MAVSPAAAELLRNYTRLGHPAAYSGVSNLKRYYPHLSVAEIRDALRHSDSYTRTREVKPPRTYNRYYMNFPREQVQVDLLELRRLSGRNRGISYWLVALDIFSKKAWMEGIKYKTAAATAAAMRRIMDRMGGPTPIRAIVADDGKEWKGAFGRLLRDKNIAFWHPRLHAVFVERFNRTIKTILARYMAQNETLSYAVAVPRALETYNNRYHRYVYVCSKIVVEGMHSTV